MDLSELESAFMLVRLLHTELDFDRFETRIYAMRTQNIRIMGIFEGETLVCCALFSVLTDLRLGTHLHLSELITDPSYRFRGYAKAMLGYLRDQARVLGCERMVINCARASFEARLLLEKEGFEEVSPMLIGSPYM